ncbi:oligosaccharide flippase family protein [Derxia gummosa]|uniref:Oligosaccharide flippase family protein n=1 Tax=Derxia gummosa DSM 723 TaxID=1121388 RepID=A0A8B6X221_9BURK|nr:oligosaccharide flippase family protein [Derxia gummosa]
MTGLARLSGGLKRSGATKVAMVMGGNIGLVITQAIQFLFLARLLGASDYGYVAAINALITIAAPLSDLGFGNLVLMRCARRREVAALELGNAVVMTLIVGSTLTLLLVAVSEVVYGGAVDWRLAALLGVAELLGTRLVTVCGNLHTAFEEFGFATLRLVLTGVARIAAIVALALWPAGGPVLWAAGFAGLNLLLAAYSYWCAHRLAGGMRVSFAEIGASLREAWHFASGALARAAYSDTDKVMLGRYAASAELGAYTSAYRIVVMAFVPVRSLLQVTVVRFFRVGQQGMRATLGITRQLLAFTVPYAICASAATWLLAPFIPQLLGPSFAAAVPMCRALALLPVIQSVQFVFADALSGAGHQAVRSRLQGLVGLTYALLGFALIPRLGWVGAAWTCLVGEGLLALLMAVAALRIARRAPAPVPAEAPATPDAMPDAMPETARAVAPAAARTPGAPPALPPTPAPADRH